MNAGQAISAAPALDVFTGAHGETVFMPSGGFYRRAIHASENPEELRAIALAVVAEHERLLAWVAQTMKTEPPRWTVHQAEAEAKGWSA